MRGNALADPTVVGLLQPFIVTFWYGHPDDDPPAELRPYLQPVPGAGGLPGGHSNVKAVILDALGKPVDAFDAMPPQDRKGPWTETIPAWFAERLRNVGKSLGLAAANSAPRAIRLPDLSGGSRGVRVFVRLDDPGMPAYNAPLVEVTNPAPADWDALSWPEKPRTLDASVLKVCFEQMYPAGVMERQDKRTMIAWKIAKAEGALRLTPAGKDAKRRYALLTGKVTLTDEGPDGFSYEGEFQTVLTYPIGEKGVESLRGTFEARYLRYDKGRNFERKMPLRVVLESLPMIDGR